MAKTAVIIQRLHIVSCYIERAAESTWGMLSCHSGTLCVHISYLYVISAFFKCAISTTNSPITLLYALVDWLYLYLKQNPIVQPRQQSLCNIGRCHSQPPATRLPNCPLCSVIKAPNELSTHNVREDLWLKKLRRSINWCIRNDYLAISAQWGFVS